MPAYNFQARFAPLVASGAKPTTIRSKPAKVGSTAYLFTGMRTKACKRLGQSVIASCQPITFGYNDSGMPTVKIGSRRLTAIQAGFLAEQDGFDDARDMVKWFQTTYKVPVCNSGCAHDVYTGYLIAWEPL